MIITNGTTYEPHELAKIFPLIQGKEFDELCDDIETHGLREPIWLYEGKILDGRNRAEACEITGTQLETQEYEGDDPLGFVLSLNLHRRHLNESQRGMVAATIANLENGGDRLTDQSANLQSASVSRQKAAEKLNVSERTVNSAKKVLNGGVPELSEKVNAGKVAVSNAAEVASLPKEEQIEIVAKGEKEILQAAKKIREKKSAKKQQQNKKLASVKMNPPKGKYSTIVIDPPWQMQKIQRDARPNQVDFDYPTMSESELINFGEVVNGYASNDSHMFMWTTHKHLPLALSLISKWNWKYVMTMVWHKPGGFQPIGLPQYNCEFCIYARIGSPAFADTKAFPACFEAPRKEHSRKPDEFYDLVRRVTHDGRIDIFSREPRPGFAQFGNEVKKYV